MKLSLSTQSIDKKHGFRGPAASNCGREFVPFASRTVLESSFNARECKKRKISSCDSMHEGLSAINYGFYCPSLFVPIEDGDSTIDSLDTQNSVKFIDDGQRCALEKPGRIPSSPEPRFMNMWSIEGSRPDTVVCTQAIPSKVKMDTIHL